MDLGGSVPGDGLMEANSVLVGPVDDDLLDQRESVIDHFAEQPLVSHGPEAAFA